MIKFWKEEENKMKMLKKVKLLTIIRINNRNKAKNKLYKRKTKK